MSKVLLGTILLTFVLQLAVIHVPFLQEFLETTALPAADLGISLLFSIVVFLAVEVEKWIIRRHQTKMS